MPIEIRELHIKAVVNNTGDQPAIPTAQPAASPQNGGQDKQAIIAECVEKVMEIMARKKEF
ncbi:MAG: DUF5908 family protein [Bacteroidota bacterium]